MTHNVHPALEAFLVDVADLVESPGNPRRGDLKAIEKALVAFGQVEPLLFVLNEVGAGEVIHGNHRLRVAVELGWDQVAAVDVTGFSSDEIQALSLAMNRVADLGSYDPSELLEKMNSMSSRDLLDSAGYTSNAVELLELVQDRQPTFDKEKSERLAPSSDMEKLVFKVSHTTADVYRSLHLEGSDEENMLLILNTLIEHGTWADR